MKIVMKIGALSERKRREKKSVQILGFFSKSLVADVKRRKIFRFQPEGFLNVRITMLINYLVTSH